MRSAFFSSQFLQSIIQSINYSYPSTLPYRSILGNHQSTIPILNSILIFWWKFLLGIHQSIHYPYPTIPIPLSLFYRSILGSHQSTIQSINYSYPDYWGATSQLYWGATSQLYYPIIPIL